MGNEIERVNEILKKIINGEDIGNGIGVDRYDGTIKPKRPGDDPNRYIDVTPPDSDLYSSGANEKIIVVSGEILQSSKINTPSRYQFTTWDNDTVFSLFHHQVPASRIYGTLFKTSGEKQVSVSDFGHPEDVVRVIFDSQKDTPKGFIRNSNQWENVCVVVTPRREEIFSRFGGLIESDVLADKKVFAIGLGSGESSAVLELSKSGVCHFVLMDNDRLEVRNVNRHIAGLSQVGRYKTKILADFIHERNPYAVIDTYEEGVSWNNMEQIRKIIKSVDLVHCGTDNRISKLIVNRLCVEEKTPCVFASAFRRAYGGQVFFYRGSNNSPCFQCALPFMDGSDKEITTPEQANGMGYTDRPVPIEPGLSTDIAPISLMTVKLSIQELLKDKQTTLRSLDEDLISPWFIWLNRREKGSPYEKLGPLGYYVDDMRILRWYGVDFNKNEECPVCGDFAKKAVKEAGADLSTLRL